MKARAAFKQDHTAQVFLSAFGIASFGTAAVRRHSDFRPTPNLEGILGCEDAPLGILCPKLARYYTFRQTAGAPSGFLACHAAFKFGSHLSSHGFCHRPVFLAMRASGTVPWPVHD